MLLVKVTYKCNPGQRETYYREALAAGIIDATKKEKGNIRYDFSYPVDAENDILLLELWEGPDDWDAHKKTPHVKDLQAIKAKYVTDTVAETFTVSKA